MGKIKLLEQIEINKIKAGEVIEEPISVIKELIENSIDAGATRIDIAIESGGLSLISVKDNGHGVSFEDAELMLTPHATSKISKIDDLFTLNSFGFRGEALSSMAAVSHVRIRSKVAEESLGMEILSISPNAPPLIKRLSCPQGTCVQITELFFNIAPRRKSLESKRKNSSRITRLIKALALASPHIIFSYTVDKVGKFIIGGNGLMATIKELYKSTNIISNLIPVDTEYQGVQITGVISSPRYCKGSKDSIFTFVNNRYVDKNFALVSAVVRAYEGKLQSKEYPFVILNFNIAPEKIDVNAHPTKREIRFLNSHDQQVLFGGIIYIINSHLSNFLSTNFMQPELDTPSLVSAVDLEAQMKQQALQENNAPILQKDILNLFQSNSDVALPNQPQQQPPPISPQPQPQQEFTMPTEIPGIEELKLEPTEGKTIYKLPDDLKILGQIWKRYILVADSSCLLIIDQHNMHELYIYRELSKAAGIIKRQHLLNSIYIKLDLIEKETLEDCIEEFNAIGFELEFSGQDLIKCNTVPVIANIEFTEKMLKEIITDISSEHTTSSIKESSEKIIKKILSSIACKAAIKSGQELSSYEIEGLLSLYQKIENPYFCPHGRPTCKPCGKKSINDYMKRNT